MRALRLNWVQISQQICTQFKQMRAAALQSKQVQTAYLLPACRWQDGIYGLVWSVLRRHSEGRQGPAAATLDNNGVDVLTELVQVHA